MHQPFNKIYEQLFEKRKALKNLPCNEQSFSKMENIFYDILTLARLQNESLEKVVMLAELEMVKDEKFRLTQQPYAKAKQKELVITHFKTALVKVLTSYLK